MKSIHLITAAALALGTSGIATAGGGQHESLDSQASMESSDQSMSASDSISAGLESSDESTATAAADSSISSEDEGSTGVAGPAAPEELDASSSSIDSDDLSASSDSQSETVD